MPADAPKPPKPRLSVRQSWRELLANDCFRDAISPKPWKRLATHPFVRPLALAAMIVPVLAWADRRYYWDMTTQFWWEARIGQIWGACGLLALFAMAEQRLNAARLMREFRDRSISENERAPSADKLAMGFAFPNVAGERMAFVAGALAMAYATHWSHRHFLLGLVLVLGALKLATKPSLSGLQMASYFRDPQRSLFATWLRMIAGVLLFLAGAWGVAIFLRDARLFANDEGLGFTEAMHQYTQAMGLDPRLAPALGFVVALVFFTAAYRVVYMVFLAAFLKKHGSVDQMAETFWGAGSAAKE
jgi:hypothetical protein